MNPWLACFIWILIAGLSGHLVWSSQWTKDGWSATAKIISCIGIAAFISWQALDALKNDKQQTAPIAPTQHKSPTVMEPVNPSEPAPPFREQVKPTPRKAPPPALTVPRKQRTAPPADIKELPTKLQVPKEKLADILIRKYPATDPALERRPKFFIREWLHVINKVNDEMPKHDLQTVLRVRPRLRDSISDSAHLAEAIFTLHCLESEGYMRITETSDRIQGYPGVVNNLEFEFVPERLNEFVEGL